MAIYLINAINGDAIQQYRITSVLPYNHKLHFSENKLYILYQKSPQQYEAPTTQISVLEIYHDDVEEISITPM